MVAAAVILQVGKVEVHRMPNVPPPYLRFMRPTKPIWAQMKEAEELVTLDIATIRVTRHRMFGFSVEAAYWPDSWSDAWAIEELLKWEGREDEIRQDKYYADFIIGEDQQARPNRTSAIEPKSVSSRQRVVVLEPLGEVHRRGVVSGPNVLGPGSPGVLRLERGVHGEYAADISGED